MSRLDRPAACGGMLSRGRNGKTPWTRPWSGAQIGSHAAVCYTTICFSVAAGSLSTLLSVTFWMSFAVTLGLYFYVCGADTKYHEVPLEFMSSNIEPRRCEDCHTTISEVRVKHCHVCNRCTAGFEHHCRYLNCCIAEKTYLAWVFFVLGLLSLQLLCLSASVAHLRADASAKELGQAGGLGSMAFWLMAAASLVLAVFLVALLGQHAWMGWNGVTTFEFAKAQEPGFPGLPQRGWRAAVAANMCFGCNSDLNSYECDDKEEVWFCSVCQVDLARAGVPFLTCDECQVSVCFRCRRLSRYQYGSDTIVTTSKLSTLRRLPEAGLLEEEGMMTSRSSSGLHKKPYFEPLSSRSFGGLIISAEGSAGDDNRGVDVCCGFWRGQDASDSSDGDGQDEPL
eukprot:TRINITY_DN47177_c0_g1_i1.p1 TRINITY_DN47177_c0_g1~~TRINITY_DN47177_c0_g1_i1.p1  ORF type:complete len:396 (-),score=56.51 TRINITY_DN47177_c0_g1_i1:20-1207(-)